MPAPVRREYVTVDGHDLHLRRAGSGPAIVLEHPMPLSSKVMVHLMDALSDRFEVFAFDRSSIDGSDRAAPPDASMADLATLLRRALEQVGVGRCTMFGHSTGAVVTLEYSRLFPELLDGIVIQNLPIFTPEQRADFLARYEPEMEPAWDGTHLVATWQVSRDLVSFWPYHRRDVDHWRDLDMPSTEAVHEMLLDQIGGVHEGFNDNLRAVFNYEHVLSQLATTRVPTTVMAREDEANFPYLDRVEALSPAARILRRPADYSGEWPYSWWYAREVAGMLAELAEDGAPAAPVLSAAPAPGLRRRYVDGGGGQLLVRSAEVAAANADASVPLVLIHDLPGSSADLAGLAESCGAERPVIAIDLPGCGQSDPFGGPIGPGAGAVATQRHAERTAAPPVLDDYARAVWQALDALGVGGQVELRGRGLGGAVAIATAAREPGRTARVSLDGAPLPDAALRDRLAAEPLAESLQLSWDGSHVLRAWTIVRDAELWWPWFARSRAAFRGRPFADPRSLHAKAAALLAALPGFADAIAAVAAAPLERLRSAVAAPVDELKPPDDSAAARRDA